MPRVGVRCSVRGRVTVGGGVRGRVKGRACRNMRLTIG